MSDAELYNVAMDHLVFEESSSEVDEAQAHRLADLLAKVQEEEASWWHREWHRATGIPCDRSLEYCPMTRRANGKGEQK